MAARENRFRFVSYKEDIKSKVIISLKNVNYLEDNEELDSYFSASVERWSSSNSGPEIADFRSRVAPHSLSLKLVHLNQKLIVNELRSFLRSTSALACTPFLDLVSSLCCDLREDFLPYLDDFLPEIFRLISAHSKNGDVLHPSFNCLSHMAYFLHRSLSRDVTNTLKIFSPVLKSTANHIAEFGAEILAFILRKVCDRHHLLQSVLQVFGDNYSLIGVLLSEVLCGSVGKLHTSAHEILPAMFDLACCTHKSSIPGIRKGIRTLFKGERRSETPVQSSIKIEAKAVSAVLRETLGRLLGSLHAGEVTYVIGLLNSRLQSMDNSEKLTEPFKEAVSILSVLISCSPKEYATSTEVAFGTCFSKALSLSPTEEILTVFTKFLLESIRRYNPFNQIRLILMDNRIAVRRRLQFLSDLSDWDLFDRDVLPNLGPFLLTLEPSDLSFSEVLSFLAVIRMSRMLPEKEPCGIVCSSSDAFFRKHDDPIFVDLNCVNLSSISESDRRAGLISRFQHGLISALEKSVNERIAQYSSCVSGDTSDSHLSTLCLSFIRPMPLDRVSALLGQLSRHAMQMLRRQLPTGNKTSYKQTMLLDLLAAVETRWELFAETENKDVTAEPFDDVDLPLLLELASQSFVSDIDSSVLALRCADIVCCARSLRPSGQQPFLQKESLVPLLLTTLQSPSHQARLHSLRILTNMFAVSRPKNEAEEDLRKSILIVLSRCLHAERIRLDAQSSREFLIPILHLHAHRDGIKNHPLSAQIALNYLIGLFHVRLTSTWPGIQDAVASYAELPRDRCGSLPLSTNIMEPTEQPDEKSAKSCVSDDWRYVACRIYWSVLEPAIELSARYIMNPADTLVEVSDNVTQISSNPLQLQNLCLRLMCRKLDATQLSAYEDHVAESDHRPINWQDYHLALWRCLLPVSSGKKSRLLVPLLLQRIRFHLQHGFKKTDQDWLQVALDLFSKFHNIKSIYHEPEFRSLMYDLLSNPRPSIQKAAFNCLLAYKNVALNNYREQLEKIIDLRTFRDEIRTFKLDFAIEDVDHRNHVAPIFLRILYGRLQISKGVFAPAVFTNLASCTDSEFSIFLALLLHPLLEKSVSPSTSGGSDAFLKTTDLCSFIRNLRDRVRNPNRSSDSISWSQLQALAKVLNNVLDYMGHRLWKAVDPVISNGLNLPNHLGHLDVVFRLGLCLIAMTQSAAELVRLQRRSSDKQTNQTQSSRLATQMKKVRASGVRLLQHIFNSEVPFDSFLSSEGRLEAVRDVCLYEPMLSRLLTCSALSTNQLLLSLVLSWSTNTYLASNLLPGPCLDTIMSLLVSKKTSDFVVESLIQVVCNLLFDEEVSLVGRKIMHPHHNSLIWYMQTRMQKLSQSKMLEIYRESRNQKRSLRLCQEFRILSYLAECALQDQSHEHQKRVEITSSQADSLLQGLLSLLTKCTIKATRHAHRSSLDNGKDRPVRPVSSVSAEVNELRLATADQMQADLIHAVTQLATIADNFEQHLKRILALFVRIDSRVCRGLLCQSVASCTLRLPAIASETLQLLEQISANPPRRTLAFVNENQFNNCLPKHELCPIILMKLNSWDLSRLDQPDVVQREYAFGLLTELCDLMHLSDPPCQTIYVHLGALCCALHTLAHENLQLRDAALDYCLRLASVIANNSDKTPVSMGRISFYRTLIQNCLWPEILRLLRDPRVFGPKRLHVLRLLRGVVDRFRSEPLFAPLSLLLCGDVAVQSSGCETDFFSNLQSGAVSRQCQAIRRMALFLRNPLTVVAKKDLVRVKNILSQQSKADFPIPERLLCDFFIPLLFFYLNPHLHLNTGHDNILLEQKRLVDHCLDALGAVARRLSWNAYRKLMDSTLSKLNKAEDVGFAGRLITCLIDAFTPPQWTNEVVGSLDSLSGLSQASIITTTTNLQLDFNIEPLDLKMESDTHLEVAQTPVDVDKAHVTESSASTDSPKAVLSYMLQVVKRLQPFITKWQKSGRDASDQLPKRFNISLVVSLVCLLKRLPPGFLTSRLPGLILQLVTVLRPSPTSTPKVREDAVKSLLRVVRVLGPGKPLEIAVNIISQQLNRGYACQQVRLFTLHKILGEIESYMSSGNHAGRGDHLDQIGSVVGAHYLDELVGPLAEEMDSRRAAGHSLSSISTVREQDVTDFQTSTEGLGGSHTTDLPEANGLKAPEGLSRLCRLLSDKGISRLFENIENAVVSAASGSAPKLKTGEANESCSNSVGCGLRYRSRALARLEATLTRLPTRSGLFSLKRCGKLSPLNLISLSSHLIRHNLQEVLSLDGVELTNVPEPIKPSTQRSSHGWKQPQSNLLEPRWNYLELESEPKRDRASDGVAQSEVTQAHLLVSCGLDVLVGLLRYRCLRPDDSEQAGALADVMPLVLECMRSKYVRVLGAALRCLNMLFTVTTSKVSSKLIPNFSAHLQTAGDRLFNLLSTHPGLLSTRTAAADPYAQQFASYLYRALSALIRHQSTYPLSSNQLLTLLNAIDIELTRDAAAAPSLSLLQAILQRRLRDPNLQSEDKSYLSFKGDLELHTRGLVVAKASDTDQLSTSGAGGGARLVDLINRLQELAITSISEHIRAESRCCLVLFLLNYPHKAKFIQSFVAFCLRQLEYKKASGRSSALSLLTGLIADLPISRLSSNNLEETILVSVGAAIEREPVRALRVGMLALIRLLFSRLSPVLAEAHFRQYLLAFVTAPADTRTSARLLGLQLVAAVLDCQPCLSLAKHRPALVKLLGTEVLPTAARQLYQVVITNMSLCKLSGLNPLFSSEKDIPTEEIARAKAALEDASWVAELKSSCRNSDSLDEEDSDVEQPNSDSGGSLNRSGFSESDTGLVCDDEDSDIDMETWRNRMHFEEVEEEVRDQCESFVPKPETGAEQSTSRSAQENHYLLISNTLEYSLRLLKRLLDFVDEASQPSPEDIYTVSDTVIPAWSVITGHQGDPTIADSAGNGISKRRLFYTQLLNTSHSKRDQCDRLSLCCAGHRGVREWATRCLASLLRVESDANKKFLSSTPVADTEAMPGAGLTRSAFFNQLRKKRKMRIALLDRLLHDSVFQLEHDAKQLLNEEWSDTLVANLVHLGLLLHLSAGRRPVLRLFRQINRIALDELNNRSGCYFQRTLVLKITTGLLLRLPRPGTDDLIDLFTNHSTKTAAVANNDRETDQPPCLAYVSYLRAASRVIAREFRQRDRLAYMTVATITSDLQDDEDQESMARARLRGIKLSKEQSARARARRHKAQARLRRMLMSGTMRPEITQRMVALTAANRTQAGPDKLMNVIEAAQSALAGDFGINGAKLIQVVCGQATRGAQARHQKRAMQTATKEALGVAWCDNSPGKRSKHSTHARNGLKRNADASQDDAASNETKKCRKRTDGNVP